MNIRYVVDGYEFENIESNLLGDGQFPPFLIFDIEAQDYLQGAYNTRAEAQAEADSLYRANKSRRTT